MAGGKPRFIADAMLGDLARWLRMLGYDTVYARDLPDPVIVEKAAREKRILLTRDRGLYIRARKKGVPVIPIDTTDIAERIAIVARRIGISLDLDPDNSRCPLCNAPLRRALRSEVRGRVPRRVYEERREFWICTGCGQVYWRGRHWRGIEAILEKARRLVGDRGRHHRAAQTR